MRIKWNYYNANVYATIVKDYEMKNINTTYSHILSEYKNILISEYKNILIVSEYKNILISEY